MTSPPLPDGSRWMQGVLLLAVLACAGVFGQRLIQIGQTIGARYDAPLVYDRLGGCVIDHCVRAERGEPVYSEPDDRFTAVVYTPLYYHAAAWMMKFLGEGAPACRLTSLLMVVIGSLAVFVALRRLSGSFWPSLGSLALMVACYSVCRFFYDSPRVDSTAAMFLLLAVCTALQGRGPANAAAIGVLLALAYWSKQSSLLFSCIFLVVLLFERPRVGWLSLVSYAFLVGTGLWWMHSSTDGWFWIYCVELPTQHDFPVERMTEVLVEDWGTALRLPLLGLLILSARLWWTWRGTDEERRLRLMLFAVLAAAVFCLASRSRTGGTQKTLIPLVFMLSLTLPAGFLWLARTAGRTRGITRLLILSWMVLFWADTRYASADAVPSPVALDRFAEVQERANELAKQGQIWVAPWGYFTTPMEGQGMRPTLLAVEDYLGVRGNQTPWPIPPKLADAIENRHFVAIFCPQRGGNRRLRDLIQEYYELQKPIIKVPVGVERFTMHLGLYLPRSQEPGNGRGSRRRQR